MPDKRPANASLPLAVILTVVITMDVGACWWILSLDVLTPLNRSVVAINFPVVIFGAVTAANLFRRARHFGPHAGRGGRPRHTSSCITSQP